MVILACGILDLQSDSNRMAQLHDFADILSIFAIFKDRIFLFESRLKT
jgi:hypothetical protein